MKKTLLLLFVCLFGALGGVKAWTTSAAPVAGKTYYLYNIGANTYWYSTNTAYGTTANIADATPVTVENDNKLAYFFGGTVYRIYHNDGTKSPDNTTGVTFTFEGNPTDGYKFKSKNDDHDRDMDNAGTFPQRGKNPSNVTWKFIPVEEGLSESGWEKVTSVASLKDKPENYMYTILSANNTSLMVRTNISDGSHGYYCNGRSPKSSSEVLFSIENYIYESKDYFVLKAGNTNAYYHAEYDKAFDLVAINQPSVDADCRLEFEYADNAWNIKTWTSYSGDPTCGSYWGLWTPNNGYKDGEKMAGNKNDEQKGSFLIYRAPKYNLSLSSQMSAHKNDWQIASGEKAVNGIGVQTYNGNWNEFAAGDVIYQTINDLPNGNYEVSFYAWENFSDWDAASIHYGNNIAQVFANDAVQGFEVIKNTAGRDFNDANKYTLNCSVTSGTLKYGVKNINPGGNWAVCSPISLTYYGTPATPADYTALQEAIYDAEAKTLGFDYEEYAPYNNVAALNALAEAKAIDQSANNQQMLVQEATNALTSKSWTANSGNVDAVFNGSFSSDVEGDGGLTGWTRTNAWGQQQTGLEGDYATAYYNQHGSLVYGSMGNYSMPLNVSQVYKLTFAYRSHESKSNNSVTASINKKGGSAVFSKQYDGNPSTTEWRVVTAFFTTQAAGDYVLTLANSGNTWMTGVSIEKLPNTVPATIGENGYTTFASTYPLDLTQANLPVGVQAYKATSINSSYVHFEKLDQVVPANTGVLLKGTAGVHDIRVGSEVAEVTDNLFLVNESNGVFPSKANTTYYAMVKNSTPMTFRKFDPSVVAVPNYKAYLAVTGGSARLTVMFDGEDPTTINAIEAAEAEDGVLKDGKYLIDGKIVLVKNGVKYGANGQKLN